MIKGSIKMNLEKPNVKGETDKITSKLIDNGFSIEQIAFISLVYILISLSLLFLLRNKLNPKYI